MTNAALHHRVKLPLRGCLLACGLLGLTSGPLSTAAPAADALRAYAEGQTPRDARLGPLKDLNGYFPFVPPQTRADWDRRQAALKRRILVATGLWPLPPATPLNPVIFGRSQRPGFTVQKVYFESLPGHFVTGLLFRPAATSDSKRPGVLCPHGHGGRLQDYGVDKMAALIKSGAEKFEKSGRFPKLARCAQLARMGCTVFIYDMLGYADSRQISYELAHRYRTTRPEFDDPQSWGFYSTQAELRMQSIMGLQTYNAIRALDFLSQLPDVDPQRLAVTGGSGGGTQTILLCAIDDRPIVAFPQGMVSTSMQGGCTCENASCLRIGTGNVELAGLFAPKPLAMTGANDWTKEIATKGLPELKQLYTLLGRPQAVMSKSLLHFPHNYNHVTRTLMYSWFNQHLKLGLPEPIEEQDYEPLTPEEYTIWDSDHPAPPGGPEHERAVTRALDQTAQRTLAGLTPRDKNALAEYRRVVGGAWDTLIGRPLPAASRIERTKVVKNSHTGYLEFADILRDKRHGEEFPIASVYPTQTAWNGQVVIWITGQGKAGLYDAQHELRPEIRRLLEHGTSVISADLLGQGEFLAGKQPPQQTRTVANTRAFAGYTHGYNATLFTQRVHDILTLIAFVVQHDERPKQVTLVGIEGGGILAAAAAAQARDQLDRVVCDTQGFRFRSLKSYRDPGYCPGAVKYGDVPGLISLIAPCRLDLIGEQGRIPAVVTASYRAANSEKNVRSRSQTPQGTPAAIIDWLLMSK